MLLLEGRIERDWVDYNGHLNVAYYHMAFDRATDVFLQRIGLGPDYVESHAGSMFALEDHLVYLHELREGEPFRITLQLLDWDSKRVHYFQRLVHGEKDFLSATCEHLSTFVDMKTRRSAQLPAATRSILGDLFEEHRHLAKPEQAGRVMGIRRA
ncbi:MAG TPA: thioesterase family protein [Vicinamibacteria bacterium]|nr:thioesterase family protein [Vicinamibacteria bacterium]